MGVNGRRPVLKKVSDPIEINRVWGKTTTKEKSNSVSDPIEINRVWGVEVEAELEH